MHAPPLLAPPPGTSAYAVKYRLLLILTCNK